MSTEVLNLNSLLVYYVAGLPMDIMHAVSTVIFILLGAKPMLKILDRIKLKYGLMEQGANYGNKKLIKIF